MGKNCLFLAIQSIKQIIYFLFSQLSLFFHVFILISIHSSMRPCICCLGFGLFLILSRILMSIWVIATFSSNFTTLYEFLRIVSEAILTQGNSVSTRSLIFINIISIHSYIYNIRLAYNWLFSYFIEFTILNNIIKFTRKIRYIFHLPQIWLLMAFKEGQTHFCIKKNWL